MEDFKLNWINNLETVSKIIELLIQDNSITSQIKDEDFIELTKNVSYYKVDEVIDYLQELRELERKSCLYREGE